MSKKAKYTHNIPRYEMTRLNRMRQNQERFDVLGLKHISTSLKDSAQSNCSKGKRSTANIVVDDAYVPPIGDDDDDDESSNSIIHKLQMAPRRLTRSRGEASIPVVQSAVQSTETPPEANPPAQSSSSADATDALTSTTGSTSRNTRGTTRGIAVRTLVEKGGKLPVRIAAEYDAPVGKNACKLVNQIGIQVRSNLSSYNVKNWKSVDAATRDVVLQNIADQFELQGDSNLVTKTLNTKCGRLLSCSSNKLHQAYKKLVQSHGADYARSHSPKNATLEQWIGLIDGKWTNKDLLEKLRKNSENRNKTVDKYRCGTKALAVRVDEETNNNGGQVPELAKIYKDVHFNPNTNRWIHHEDEATYETILKVQEDHCQDPNAIPLTQEEISNLVFKRKFGIVKGLGMRPSSSLPCLVVAGSSTHKTLDPLMSMLAQPGAVFGHELGAILMDPGMAVVRSMTVVDFFNAKPMNLCPDASSYPKDDAISTFSCNGGTNYKVVFCP
ncbi:hypothetical protein SO802_033947 [Lithocarpus litseifolius]|uniref:Uncharacterized protein n=1 Tax=Lithocarpus litseifolius TaxID=425828 RepID=A0AAW2BGQ1_9ROSI